jgi:hypothetical protein
VARRVTVIEEVRKINLTESAVKFLIIQGGY